MTTFYCIAFFTATYFATAYIAYLIGKVRGEEKSAKVAKDYYENLLHVETERAFVDGYKKGFAAGAQQGYNDGKREAEIVAHNKKILRKAGILK